VAVEALAGAGYRAVPAPDGATALALLDGAGPPIGAVLLDLRRPGPDGRAFAARLRARPRGAPPLIVFTAAPPAEAAAAAAALGAAGVVAKPFDLDALVAVVARCLAPPPAAAPVPAGAEPAGWRAPAGKDAPERGARRRQLVRLRTEVARLRAALPALRAELRGLAAAEAVRRLTPDEARRAAALRRQLEALRLELALFREEFARLGAPGGACA
jgi:CheY-like chemotaxis protein